MDASTIAIAAFGGLSVNLLNLAEMGALAPDRRPNLRDPLYWLAFPIGALLAAFVGYVYLASGFRERTCSTSGLSRSSDCRRRRSSQCAKAEHRDLLVSEDLLDLGLVRVAQVVLQDVRVLAELRLAKRSRGRRSRRQRALLLTLSLRP